MPKIKIEDIDKTGTLQIPASSNTVLFPLTENATGSTVSSGNPETGLIEVNSIKEFNDKVSSVVNDSTDEKDNKALNIRICKHLLSIGFKVVVALVPETSPKTSFFAESGAKSGAENGAENGAESEGYYKDLTDKGLYDIRFIVCGDASEDDGYLAKIAENRGDCILLVSPSEEKDNKEVTPFDAASIVKYYQDLYGSATNYVAAFTPGFITKVNDLVASDKSEATISAEFGYLFAYAYATKNGSEEWEAIAGPRRGVIPELSKVVHKYNSSEIEVLQGRAATGEVDLDYEGDNVGVAVNPIAYVRPFGNVIYGNRTLHDNQKLDGLVASSFLNIRNCVNAIKKRMYSASRTYTFEQNTNVLWINFQNYIKPLLDRMKTGNGILDYEFIKLKTDKKARIKARLNIIPIEAVEDFDLEIALLDDLNITE